MDLEWRVESNESFPGDEDQNDGTQGGRCRRRCSKTLVVDSRERLISDVRHGSPDLRSRKSSRRMDVKVRGWTVGQFV